MTPRALPRRPLPRLVMAMLLLLAQAFVPGLPATAAPVGAICHTGDAAPAPARHDHGQDCLLCPVCHLAAAPAAIGPAGPSVPVRPAAVVQVAIGTPDATGPPAPPYLLPAARGPPAACV